MEYSDLKSQHSPHVRVVFAHSSFFINFGLPTVYMHTLSPFSRLEEERKENLLFMCMLQWIQHQMSFQCST